MKKFLATVPRQTITGGNIYHAVDNPRLQYDAENHFPVLALINGYAQPGDSIVVYAITADDAHCRQNLLELRDAVLSLCQQLGVTCRVDEVAIPFDESLETHLSTFTQLITLVDDHDTLFADITYGTKPTPILQMLALNFAYRAKIDVSIGCVAYGEKNHRTGCCRMFDVTALVLMDEIVNNLAKMKVPDPSDSIKKLLGLAL